MAVQEQFVVDAKGKKIGVILPLRRYQRLLEDMHDLAIVAEHRSQEPVGLEEMTSWVKSSTDSGQQVRCTWPFGEAQAEVQDDLDH